MIEIWVTMMVPNNDITKSSHSCNWDVDDGIITRITSAPRQKIETILTQSKRIPTRTTTTTNVSNMCCGGGNDDSSTSSSLAMYFFARTNYEKQYIVLCLLLFNYCYYFLKRSQRINAVGILIYIYIYIYCSRLL